MTPEEIKTTMPYPIASVYSDLDNPDASPQTKREALYFTGYQLMRTIALTLMGQYFTQDLPGDLSKQKRDKLNRAIAGVRCPHYSDWISLINSFNKYDTVAGLDFFAEFDEAMEQIKNNPVDLPENEKAYHLEQGKKWQNVTWLQALWGLRNGAAHSGMGRDEVCLEAVTYFRPFVDSLLNAFSFLSRYELLVLRSTLDEDEPSVQLLRGLQITEPQAQEIDDALYDAFTESPVVMRSPEGRVQSLFPFFHGHIEGEPIRYYDGHYLRDNEKDSKMNRRMIYYLGGGQRLPLEDSEAFKLVETPPAESNAAEHLRQFLEGRDFNWQMQRNDIAPWTLRDMTNDYARRTLEELIGIKYLPECYLDRPKLSELLWKLATDNETSHRAILFTGRTGSGKTALLSDLTRRLLDEKKDHLVLFMRGGSVNAEIKGNNLLLSNLQHKIGLNETEFSTFAEFFNHFAGKLKEDKISNRRFIIVLDAVNEARKSMQLMSEALEMIEVAREYNWLRIVLSAREEFMSVWNGRRSSLETNPFYSVRSLFVLPPEDSEHPVNPEDPPAWFVPKFTEAEAAEVYSRYRTAKENDENVSACLTRWNEIPPPTRQRILVVPLNLDLWMRAFDGRQAPAISGTVELFENYLTNLRGQFDKFWESMAAILDYMMQHGRMALTDADAHEIGDDWRKRISQDEQRWRFSPLETACVSGVMKKRTTDEGGGYQIPHQRLREVLLYMRMKDRNPKFEKEIIEGWLSLPRTEELDGALAMIGNNLWLGNRPEDLAAFPTTDMGMEALARMLARRLVLQDESDILTKRIEKLLDSMPTEESATLQMSRLFLLDISEKVEGLPVTSGLQIFWEKTLIRLESRQNQFKNNSELKRYIGIAYNKLGDIYRDTGDSKKALDFYVKSLRIREKLYQAEPDRTRLGRGIGYTYERLGDIYKDAGETNKALQYYEKYSELFRRLHEEKPDRTDLARGKGLSYERLGDINRIIGNNDKALQYYQEYSEIFEKLYEADPDSTNLSRYLGASYERLGDIYRDTGDSQKAMLLHEKCLQVRKKLNQDMPQRRDLAREVSYSYERLGDIYQSVGKNGKALNFYQNSLEIREKLYQAEPQRTDLARDVSISYNNLGEIYHQRKETNKALTFYQKSLDIREKLYQAEPHRVDLARYVSLSYERLGDFYKTIDETSKALENYLTSLRIREKVYLAEPERIDLARDIGISYENLGEVYQLRDASEKALEFYQKSLKIREEIHQAEPQRTDLTRYVGISNSRLGDIYYLMGENEKALDFHRKSLAIREKLYHSQPHQADMTWDVVVSYGKIAEISGSYNSEESKTLLRRGRDILRELKKAEKISTPDIEQRLKWFEENLAE